MTSPFSLQKQNKGELCSSGVLKGATRNEQELCSVLLYVGLSFVCQGKK
jgi:hypothetical protein